MSETGPVYQPPSRQHFHRLPSPDGIEYKHVWRNRFAAWSILIVLTGLALKSGVVQLPSGDNATPLTIPYQGDANTIASMMERLTSGSTLFTLENCTYRLSVPSDWRTTHPDTALDTPQIRRVPDVRPADVSADVVADVQPGMVIQVENPIVVETKKTGMWTAFSLQGLVSPLQSIFRGAGYVGYNNWGANEEFRDSTSGCLRKPIQVTLDKQVNANWFTTKGFPVGRMTVLRQAH